jgi:hypothetical protein
MHQLAGRQENRPPESSWLFVTLKLSKPLSQSGAEKRVGAAALSSPHFSSGRSDECSHGKQHVHSCERYPVVFSVLPGMIVSVIENS